jgi:hypothetical protein
MSKHTYTKYQRVRFDVGLLEEKDNTREEINSELNEIILWGYANRAHEKR